ncbi:MAG: MATE family efflux transporter, partial [Firmicutes bacterium]|nr:MATE family efflux transporter [Bacillota bacterium]
MADNHAHARPAGGPPAGNKMGTAPIPGLLFKMALPAVCSMMVQAIYKVVDSIIVSMLSESALAAVTLVFPVQMLLVAVGVGTGIGINSLIARRLGQKNFEDANAAATHGLFLAFCSWVVFFLAGLFLSRPFYSWYSDDPALVGMATTYGSIVLCVSIFTLFQCICEKILQGTGNMILPMISHLIGCIVNLILDPIMIFGYFGCPAFGVAGAALATVIGQGFGMAVVLFFVLKKQKEVKIQLKGFRPQGRIIKDIYTVALPGMIMQAIPSFVNIFLNMILIGFSTTAVTVLGVYFKLQSFVFMPTFGLGQGALPIMGYNFGARNRERLMQTLKLAVGSAIVIMTVGLALFQEGQ